MNREKSTMENLAAQPTFVGHVARVLLRWFGVTAPAAAAPPVGGMAVSVLSASRSESIPFSRHTTHGKGPLKKGWLSTHKTKAAGTKGALSSKKAPSSASKTSAAAASSLSTPLLAARGAMGAAGSGAGVVSGQNSAAKTALSSSKKVRSPSAKASVAATVSSLPDASSAEQGAMDAVVPGAVVVPGLNPTPVAKAPVPGSTPSDPWAGRQNEAITLAMYRKICGGDATVVGQAKIMLEDMHERELIHAADTGERLYLPDKISWTALREEGALYRVYLNFSALQASGERAQARSYQFTVELQQKLVNSDDSATQQDFLNKQTPLVHKHNPMADDIVSLLSGIDELDKQKMRAIIVEKSHTSKKERKKIEQAISAAEDKVQRAIVYFRTKYAEDKLRNIGKAYNFTALLEG